MNRSNTNNFLNTTATVLPMATVTLMMKTTLTTMAVGVVVMTQISKSRQESSR
jgi:hypothetical protein